jgi:hypothetical protein
MVVEFIDETNEVTGSSNNSHNGSDKNRNFLYKCLKWGAYVRQKHIKELHQLSFIIRKAIRYQPKILNELAKRSIVMETIRIQR